MSTKLTVTLSKSPIGYEKSQAATARALGLTKMQTSRTHDDNPVIRGMIHKIRHLVSVVETQAE